MNDLLKLNFSSVLYFLITVFWLGEFLLFPGGNKKKESEGKNTFFKILAAIILNLIVAIFFTIINLGNFSGKILIIIRYLGLTIYLMGLITRYYSIFLLGKSFTRVVVITKEDDLVSRGLYSKLRHPLYLGLFLLTTGAVSYIGNIIAILITLLSIFIVINKRIKEEERYMENIMGDKYRRWKEKRYRFIPFVY